MRGIARSSDRSKRDFVVMSSYRSGTGIWLGFSIEFGCDNDGGRFYARAHCVFRELNNPKPMMDAISFINRDANV